MSRTKISINDAINFAQKMEGHCLSSIYKNAHSKLHWKCKCGNEWHATFNNIKRGTWCPTCANIRVAHKLKFNIDSAQRLAKKMGGKCLSTEYINSKRKLKWQCNFGHTWFAKYDNINSGRWCPFCKNKTQLKLYNIFKSIFPNYIIKMNYNNFDFLINKDTNRKQHIDILIYSDDFSFSLAVEYDGEQHYKPIRFGGMSNEEAQHALEYTRKMDELKSGKITKYGLKNKIKHFVRFSYTDDISFECVVKRLVAFEIV